jgi:CBS domain-containing protein
MPNITYCYREDLLIDIAKILIEKQIDAMPVIKEGDGNFEVVGRITKTNITKLLVALANDEVL